MNINSLINPMNLTSLLNRNFITETDQYETALEYVRSCQQGPEKQPQTTCEIDNESSPEDSTKREDSREYKDCISAVTKKYSPRLKKADNNSLPAKRHIEYFTSSTQITEFHLKQIKIPQKLKSQFEYLRSCSFSIESIRSGILFRKKITSLESNPTFTIYILRNISVSLNGPFNVLKTIQDSFFSRLRYDVLPRQSIQTQSRGQLVNAIQIPIYYESRVTSLEDKRNFQWDKIFRLSPGLDNVEGKLRCSSKLYFPLQLLKGVQQQAFPSPLILELHPYKHNSPLSKDFCLEMESDVAFYYLKNFTRTCNGQSASLK